MQLFYALKANCYNKGLYVFFSFFLTKAFFTRPDRVLLSQSNQ